MLKQNKKIQKNQYLNTGNRCGHDPRKINLHLLKKPSFYSHSPPVIQTTVSQILTLFSNNRAIRRYFDRVLAERNLKNGKPCSINKDGSYRKRRTEREESCCISMAAILIYTDLNTLWVGTPKLDGSFQYRSFKEIQSLTGLGEKRFQRAILDLKDLGFIKVQELKVINKEGEYRSRIAIKSVNEEVFGLLGVSDKELKVAREYARRSQKYKLVNKQHKLTSEQKSLLSYKKEPLQEQGSNNHTVLGIHKYKNKTFNNAYEEKKHVNRRLSDIHDIEW